MGILNGDSIVERARSFATILASSQEFQRFHSAQERLDRDNEARSLLEKFQKKQQEFQMARMSGRGFGGDEIYEIQELQSRLQDNFTIMEWARAQQDAIALIQDANQVISIAAGFDFGQSSSSGSSC